MRYSRFAAALALITALQSGCIHHESTIHRDAPRVKVEFENETAGRVFYETLSRIRPAGESTTSVEIPVVFEHKQHVVTGDGERFNNAVRECDTNQDGKISEVEARIFASRHK